MGLEKKVGLFLYILMGCVFLPVLLCVIFIGNNMDYNEGLKLATVRPNYLLFIISLLGIGMIAWLIWITRKISMAGKANHIMNGVLAVLFLLLFFVNIRVAKEIIFTLPWDVGVVGQEAREAAEGTPMGYFVYFSMNTNNIPIVYILKELYSKAAEWENYPYVDEFIWIQVNCALISVGGFFACLTVKKLTKELIPTVITFLLYLVLAGISPWKIAPYTDTYGIVFPIMCIYFYIWYRDESRRFLKYLLAALAVISGMAGGFVKPSVYVVVIALLGVEFIGFCLGDRKKWKYFLMETLLVAVLFLAKGSYMDHMMEDLGLDFNPEIETGWQSYFYMGLNEEYTGSYSPYDAGMIGEFQDSKKERNKAALERAVARMEERGFLGNNYFWLRKMVMVFNDGTFGWRGEVWIAEDYPQNLAGNDECTEWLRNIFWPSRVYTGAYNTICQLAWIFCIVGIPGICFCKKEEREKYLIFAVSFLGIFFYQMFFEARARYLLVFLALLIAISICGMRQYVSYIECFRPKRRRDPKRDHMESKQEAER